MKIKVELLNQYREMKIKAIDLNYRSLVELLYFNEVKLSIGWGHEIMVFDLTETCHGYREPWNPFESTSKLSAPRSRKSSI